MQKLQSMLDKAFGAPKAPREPERPSEGFLERGRALAERAKKIELHRLASPAAERMRRRGHSCSRW